MNCFCGCKMEEKNIQKNSYFLCPNCGFLSKNNHLSSMEEKTRYDEHKCDLGYLKYMEGVAKKILPYTSGECLDYGCGQIHALSDILNTNGISCEFYDLYYYPTLKDKKYDTIILIEVFEHIKDVLALLLDLKERLKENGKIIIMTQKKKEPLDDWWYLRDITHVSFVEDSTMEKLGELIKMKLVLEKDYYVYEK